ncbi:MAG: hypothetical protein HC854_06330 [Flavobacterium sp.]|nr:hypothetical protein [Flavobacterium sp.]
MRTRLGMALDGYISKARTSLVNISQRQLSKFNTATVIFDRVSGKFFFGRNKGIEMSKTKIHPDLEKMLPEKSLNQYKLGNCAECDAVNQALWARKGAKMEDFDMFTKGVKSDGSTFPKIQCDNCQVTFPDIKDYTPKK